MTLRQTLVLSEGISQLCKYLVWFDLLVVTVESFRFDVEKGLRNKLRTLNQETLTASLPSDSFHFSSNLV